MRTLNLGILAHVDAGKTSLTERLLHAAGVVDELGSVDDGTSHTDFLDLERRRGITIKAAVVSFVVGDVTINLIDTPGHPDFIAEVERVLSVLDGAVLVISAVEGVQPQTRLLMRTLQRLRIPTVLFVNKIDRVGAQEGSLLRAMAGSLTSSLVAMGTTRDLGSRDADFVPFGPTELDFTPLADHDDRVLAAFVDETAPSYDSLWRTLVAQTERAKVHPVFFGSAITGAGVDALTEGITGLLPAIHDDADGPLAGTVFKIDRGPAGERIAYVRLFGGALRVRDRVDEHTVTGIEVFDRGATVRRSCAIGGEIAKVWGLGEVRIGDAIGERRRTRRRAALRTSHARDRGRARPGAPRRSAQPRSPSSPSRTRSSACASTRPDRSSTFPSTARCRRRSSRPHSPRTSTSTSSSARRHRSASSAP